MNQASTDPIELRPFDDAGYDELPALFALLESQIAAPVVVERVAAMRAQGWQCLGAFAGREIVAMAGYSRRQHLFSGPVAYVENLVVVPAWRGHRIGERLMRWIEEWATAHGCNLVTLDAYASNHAAREFYARLGYDPRGIHFVRELR